MSGGPKHNPDPAVIADGFISARPAHAMSHASTIASSGGRLVAAWFAGSLESRPDVSIMVARNEGKGWSEPVEVANGKQHDGRRYACWNPVLFQPESGPLLLFYKVGKNPRSWWGMCTESSDHGRTWSTPRRLADGILGPIKNKPVQLANGEVLSPSSTESDYWRIHIEHSDNLGASWKRIHLFGDGAPVAAIQPSILTHAESRLQLICRTRHKRIAESWSSDGGKNWTGLQLTSLKNPNSGTDAVTLADGRQLLVYNRSSRRRTPLNIALSRDGRNWRDCLVLARGFGEYSYPAVIQADDGLVHVTYSWNLSRIRHVVIDPGKLH
ncbi:MAG: exo-alpha-sialidase [Thiogranum sp.]